MPMLDNLDNNDIAVLTRINELAARYGLKPYHFVATLDNSREVDGLGVRFVVPAETDVPHEAKVKKMMHSLGVDPHGILKGGEIAVIDAIDAALQRAPR